MVVLVEILILFFLRWIIFCFFFNILYYEDVDGFFISFLFFILDVYIGKLY